MRALVRATCPEFTEYVRNGVIRYGRSTAIRDWLLYIATFRDHLNLGFGQGLAAMVPDPSGIIVGTGPRMRHVTLRTVADVERPALRAALRAAAKVKPEQLPPPRRGQRRACPPRKTRRAST